MVAGGSVASGFEGVADAFERNFAAHGEVGAAFCAFVDGEPVVDLWGGYADPSKVRPWREDTLATVYSGTKGLTATCMLRLIERGLLDLDAPVCSYWPEFAAAGKEGILVRHAVSHSAGLPGLTTPVSGQEVGDSVRMAQLVAAQVPLSAPGEAVAYHALTFGWLCGELLRRVDGRSIGRFWREEVAEPLRLDAWIGLPEEHEPRVAVLALGDSAGKLPPYLPPGAPGATERERVVWSMIGNPPGLLGSVELTNSRAWRAGEVPAANGVASARAMARLYGALACGGVLDDVRVLQSETVALGARELARGEDPYLGGTRRWGVGFDLPTDEFPVWMPADGFSCGGAGGSHHGAWPSLRTGFSYTMNVLADPPDPRAHRLLDALRDALER
jgi:CubicO group peptidase (beta-lactamase class C family)